MYFDVLSLDLYRCLLVNRDILIGFYINHNKIYGRFFDGKGIYKKLIAIRDDK